MAFRTRAGHAIAMMRRPVAAAVVSVALASPARAQGVNCDNPKPGVETLVCQSAELRELDAQVERQYLDNLSRGSSPAAEARTRFNWLKQRDSCKDESCLQASYRERALQVGSRAEDAAESSPRASEEVLPEPADATSSGDAAGARSGVSPKADTAVAKPPASVPADLVTQEKTTRSLSKAQQKALYVPFGVMCLVLFLAQTAAFKRGCPRNARKARAGTLNTLVVLINMLCMGVALESLPGDAADTTELTTSTLWLAGAAGGLILYPFLRQVANSQVGVWFDPDAGIVSMPKWGYFRSRIQSRDVRSYQLWITENEQVVRDRVERTYTYHVYVNLSSGTRKFTYLTRGGLSRMESLLTDILASQQC